MPQQQKTKDNKQELFNSNFNPNDNPNDKHSPNPKTVEVVAGGR
jgi:hypothetical protein